MSEQYTVAVIGCGAIAQTNHLPGYNKRDDVGRIVVADPEPRRLAEATGKFRVAQTYADYRDLFAHERPHVVSVCSPNAFHADHAVAALEAGAHMLLEKPIAISMAEAERIRAAAEKAGTKVMVGFTHRLYRGNRTIKELLSNGAIGEPFMIRVRFAHLGPFPGWAKSDWFYDPRLAGGGALLDMGIHAIDLCQWLLGPITSVSALMGTLRKPIALDDNAVLSLEFGGRALGYIEVGWTSPPGFSGVEIYGDKGSIIDNYREGLRVCRGKETPDVSARPEFAWEMIDEAPTTGGWGIEMDYFMDTVVSGGDFEMGLQAGIDALAVALAAMESARTGQKVGLQAPVRG